MAARPQHYGAAGSILGSAARVLWRPVGERLPWIAPLSRPIFITGTGRSNTTFLAECLGAHPETVAPGPEWNQDWEQCTGTGMGGPRTLRRHCPFEDGSGSSEAQVGALRRRLAFRHARHGGTASQRFVTHSPHLVNKLGLVRRAFSDAVIVVTFRDLFSTAASLKVLHERLGQRHARFHCLPDDPASCWSCLPAAEARGLPPARRSPGSDAAVLGEYWLRMYELAQAFAESGAPVIWCDHARFLADPEGELQRIADAAGLGRHTFRLRGRVDPVRNRRWRDILARTEQRQLHAFVERNRQRLRKLWISDSESLERLTA